MRCCFVIANIVKQNRHRAKVIVLFNYSVAIMYHQMTLITNNNVLSSIHPERLRKNTKNINHILDILTKIHLKHDMNVTYWVLLKYFD